MKVFFGCVMMAIGALIAVTCGLCSLAMATSGGRSAPTEGAIVLVTLFGGVPTLFGVAVFVVGLHISREPRRPRADGGAAR